MMQNLKFWSNKPSQTRIRRQFLAAALGLLTLTAAAGPAGASLVLAMDLADLVGHSDHIAVVDVVSMKSDWDDSHERILTTIVLQVVESWKGPATPAARITIVQPGGTVGDISMVVFGMSQFQVGERSVVFLRGSMAAAAVVGMAQGKRAVRRDDAGRWMADAPDRRGTLFLRPGAAGGAAPAPASDPTFRVRTLAEFRQDVQGILKAVPK